MSIIVHKPTKLSGIPSVNYHPLQQCNMACEHCFAKNLSNDGLKLSDAMSIVKMLPDAGFEKINFAGGEPMLYPGLYELVRKAKNLNMTTSIVTNGSCITKEWLCRICGYLDWIALSIDSINLGTNVASGRATSCGAITKDRYLEIAELIRQHGIRLKINTVVTLLNHKEDMTMFIRELKPERWKIMQVLTIMGQNDSVMRRLQVTTEQFYAYVMRHRSVEMAGITIVPEDNNLMTGSYVMIDPLGRFFDNVNGRYSYSRPILEVGIDKALSDVQINPDRFEERDGRYDW